VSLNVAKKEPADQSLPRHIAIVMDGNGRWAKQRKRPRVFGHRAGVKAVRGVVSECLRLGVDSLTLFAFSSENWRRPSVEISGLMDLFLGAIRGEAQALHEHGVRVRFIGDLTKFSSALVAQMHATMELTSRNDKLNLSIAVNYGGRWDIVRAARDLAERVLRGDVTPAQIDETVFNSATQLANLPPPDLFIRTGGETRISNFLLWQLAYTELYFSPILWPDFGVLEMQQAVAYFGSRERRFGQTSEQVKSATR
jgi:undecaprenyl diphosphate synthase